MDKLTPEKRSWNMSRIRNNDTSIEVLVRHYLFSYGFRYRKNATSLPGKPDIVLPKYHSIIFVHGCFWHRHDKCKKATIPSTRTEFWQNKFSQNMKRDIDNEESLKQLGWRVFYIWECEVESCFEETMNRIIKQMTDC